MKKESALLLHLPHSSTAIPQAYQSIYPDRALLQRELLRMTDRYTDELFQSDDTRIVFPVSRLLCDVERFREPAMECMTKKGMWICYTRCSDGRLLAEFGGAHIRHILRRYYDAHHRRFFELTEEKLRAFGQVLIVDCHSFPSAPLPYELSQRKPRPDICIGTDAYHTPEALVRGLEACFRKNGFSTKRNEPFSGTIVPLPYFRKVPAVHSVMLEVNRALYMDEASANKKADFAAVSRVLREALAVCRRFCETD